MAKLAQEVSVITSFLKQEFLVRKNKNPHYSMRSFARFLKISPGRLSEYFSGRRCPSTKSAARFILRLGLEKEKCLELLDKETRTKLSFKTETSVDYYQLSNDQFQVLASWEHFALLSLMETDGFKADPRFIAKRLGISPVEASLAFERLERLGLVTKSLSQKWQPSKIGLKTTEDISSAALRTSHKQSLLQAIDSLEKVPVEFRDISSITMAINVNKINDAKKLIRKFRRDLASLVERGPRNEVYNLNIQLVPVTQLNKRSLLS